MEVMSIGVRAVASSLALLVVLGCRDDPAPAAPARTANTVPEAPPKPVDLQTLQPATVVPPTGSQTPNIYAAADGELVLTWLQPSADERLALRLARRTNGGWTEPVTVIEGALFDNWADFPAAGVLPDGTLVATWLERFEAGGGYGTRWSRSTDEGATWSPPQTLHEHTGGPEYGFVSMASTPDDRLAVFWLDGRAAEGDRGQMQLRTAIIGRDGPPTERGLVDDRVCDCCQTAAAGTPGGPVIAYRDRSVDEIRDIHVAGPLPRLGEPVHDDAWEIEGCPVNGPSLSADGDRLGIAWFTAADDRPRVQAAFGTVGGAFAPPVPLDLGDPLGRVSLVMLGREDAVVTFMERQGDDGQATILARRVTTTGEVGPPYRVARTSAAHASGFPRTALAGDRIVWAFTDAAEGHSQVRVVEAPAAAITGPARP